MLEIHGNNFQKPSTFSVMQYYYMLAFAVFEEDWEIKRTLRFMCQSNFTANSAKIIIVKYSYQLNKLLKQTPSIIDRFGLPYRLKSSFQPQTTAITSFL